jgi:hypothetical protein
MEKEFVNYEQALAIKQLGFDEPCLKYWNGIGEYFDQKDWFNWNQSKKFVSIPLYQQAFRFFREKHNLSGGVYSNASGWAWEIHDNIGGTHRFSSKYTGDCLESGMFTSFEKAELDCLKYLIEIVKNK